MLSCKIIWTVAAYVVLVIDQVRSTFTTVCTEMIFLATNGYWVLAFIPSIIRYTCRKRAVTPVNNISCDRIILLISNTDWVVKCALFVWNRAVIAAELERTVFYILINIGTTSETSNTTKDDGESCWEEEFSSLHSMIWWRKDVCKNEQVRGR